MTPEQHWWSPSEIKAAAKKQRLAIDVARKQVEVEIAKLEVIQAMCEHPKSYETCYEGDSGTRCPDCGYST